MTMARNEQRQSQGADLVCSVEEALLRELLGALTKRTTSRLEKCRWEHVLERRRLVCVMRIVGEAPLACARVDGGVAALTAAIARSARCLRSCS